MVYMQSLVGSPQRGQAQERKSLKGRRSRWQSSLQLQVRLSTTSTCRMLRLFGRNKICATNISLWDNRGRSSAESIRIVLWCRHEESFSYPWDANSKWCFWQTNHCFIGLIVCKYYYYDWTEYIASEYQMNRDRMLLSYSRMTSLLHSQKLVLSAGQSLRP